MVDGWVRAAAAGAPDFGVLGAVPMIGVSPGQTVLRAWWNFSAYGLYDDVNVYPPGNSILRAGVVYDVAGLSTAATPFPVTNADADWLAITTIGPHIVDLTQAVNTVWQINWHLPIDLSIKSQRRNDTAGNFTLYSSFEFALNGQAAGFQVAGWSTSIDAYMRTP